MEESKGTFPEFGNVSDDPGVVVPYGSPRTITIQVGLRLVVNFAYADAVRIVASNHTVVPHLEMAKDVTKIVKIPIKSKMHSGGTGMERDFRTVLPTLCFSHLLVAVVLFST